LRESERSLRELLETLPTYIWCTAPDGTPLYFSQKFRNFVGFDVGEGDADGVPRLPSVLNAIIHPDDLEAVNALFARSLATGEPNARKHRLRRFDGQYRWVETRAGAMRNGEGAIVQWNGVCLDIDDQMRAENALRRASDRLARATQAASLSELSASIAHEVNQPLAANSYACYRWLSAEPANVERAKITAESIIRNANSAADVVSRIRALFKQSMDPRSSTTFSNAISEARGLVAEDAMRTGVRIEVDVEDNLPLVAFDRVQIQQVLINLIRNGMDAMDTAATRKVLGIRVRRTGDVIQTDISDHGQDIKCPDKMFEPFFTTKENGMGMGLAICRSTVEAHGGRLWAEENEPCGSKFIFTLPVEVPPAS
jgi:PAS domain S-box-containing protein